MERIADYEIVSPLGRANHGELFLARPPERLGIVVDAVVLKVLDARSSEATFRRVTRELRAFAATRSEYLVVVYEAGQDRDLFFYAMEHHPDGTLGSAAVRLRTPAVVHAVACAARAAHALHEAGIAHRDIRPENIYVLDGSARLGELGLAQLIAPGQTVTGVSQQSSIEYLDPQILLGGHGSRATDIWSLGLTLHRALTGAGVYGEVALDDPLRAFRTLLTTEPVLSPALSDAERDVVERCLAPAGQRYPTAAALAADLDLLVALLPWWEEPSATETAEALEIADDDLPAGGRDEAAGSQRRERAGDRGR
jgi:eukaryotic-like serine/threonine-protein kinase